MSRVFTPTNQIRLTNVCIVRLKKGGKRFELACYPNKVLSWRDNIESNIDEVLQTHTIFENVSKGSLAKKEDIKQCFKTDDEEKAVMEILKKGELQVSEKERQHITEKLFRDIATMVADKCVDPETQRPLTVGIVERAMKEIHYGVQINKSTKKQALDVIRLLKDKIPIARAQMRLKITSPPKDNEKIKKKIKELINSVEKEDLTEKLFEMVIFIIILILFPILKIN